MDGQERDAVYEPGPGGRRETITQEAVNRMSAGRLKSVTSKGIKELFPGYFALVMATGIVSIASQLLGFRSLAVALFYVNIVCFAVLWVMVLFRLLFFFPSLAADLASHMRGPGFFTLVAGTCVLGSQFVVVIENFAAATALWALGIVLWFIIIYSFFTAVTIREDKPSLEAGLNGAWLIASVATHSVSVLGSLIAPRYPEHQETILTYSLTMYLIGCLLYLIIISLIFYRWTFFSVKPETMTPPYWINMGAVAITTLAGARLILEAPSSQFLQDILPFLKGFTMFFWATGTWWIPLLVILGIWRHLIRRLPFTYDPQYWGMVFPLGMYTTCTFQLAKATGISWMDMIPKYFIYAAIFAWTITFLGLVWRLVNNLFVAPAAPETPPS